MSLPDLRRRATSIEMKKEGFQVLVRSTYCLRWSRDSSNQPSGSDHRTPSFGAVDPERWCRHPEQPDKQPRQCPHRQCGGEASDRSPRAKDTTGPYSPTTPVAKLLVPTITPKGQ